MSLFHQFIYLPISCGVSTKLNSFGFVSPLNNLQAYSKSVRTGHESLNEFDFSVRVPLNILEVNCQEHSGTVTS